MKTTFTQSAVLRTVTCLIVLTLISFTLSAAEKKIVVIEKSANAADKTNHAANGTNLPPGSTAVEVSSLADAATKILAELGPGDCIKELHFRGHAAPGIQGVGDGVNNDPDKHINGANDTVWKTALAGLKGKFCPGATIYMWGCNMGADSAGAAKLKQVADFFGVTTKAPTETMTAGGQTTYTGGMKTAEPSTPAPAPTPAPQHKAKKKKHEEKQAIMVASSSVDLDFFALTQITGMVDDSLTFHSNYDSTHFTSTLTGFYNGTPVNVIYSGSSSGNASGPWSWTSGGLFGTMPWNGAGTASYTGSGDTFQLIMNTTFSLGTNTANAGYIIDGTTNTIQSHYQTVTGSILVNSEEFPVKPSLTIDWVNKTVTNDVDVWGVDVVISEWTFDEIQKAVEGILKWVKDQVFPTINAGLTFAGGTTGTGGILTVSGMPGAIWDDRLSLPGYVMLHLVDQAGNLLAAFPPAPDGSFGHTLPNVCTCVTGLVLVAIDDAGNTAESPLAWFPPPPPPIDPSRIPLLIMGTCVDQDFFALTQTNGMIDDSVNFVANYTPTGNWTASMNGIYNGMPLNVIYNGMCSSAPGMTTCNWSSTGMYGPKPWSSNGNATFTGPGGLFMVNYNSSVTIGTTSSSSSYTINGVESPTEIVYMGSSGSFVSNPPLLTISGAGPSITIDMVNKTVTNDVHLGWGVEVVLSEWTFDEIARAVEGILKWVKDNYFPTLVPGLVQFTPSDIIGQPGCIDDDRIQIPGYVTLMAMDQNNLPLGNAMVNTDGSFIIPGVDFTGVTDVIFVVVDNYGNTTTAVVPIIPAMLVVSDQFIEPDISMCFQASQEIFVAGPGHSFVVMPGGAATFVAGQSIHFYEGTTVLPGGYLHAYIAPGGPYCPPSERPLGTEGIATLPAAGDVPVIYPNPVSGILNVRLPEGTVWHDASLRLLSMTGRQVLQQHTGNQRVVELMLHDIPAGVYLLRIDAMGQSALLKVVKL